MAQNNYDVAQEYQFQLDTFNADFEEYINSIPNRQFAEQELPKIENILQQINPDDLKNFNTEAFKLEYSSIYTQESADILFGEEMQREVVKYVNEQVHQMEHVEEKTAANITIKDMEGYLQYTLNNVDFLNNNPSLDYVTSLYVEQLAASSQSESANVLADNAKSFREFLENKYTDELLKDSHVTGFKMALEVLEQRDIQPSESIKEDLFERAKKADEILEKHFEKDNAF
jgi:hypothetical protein